MAAAAVATGVAARETAATVADANPRTAVAAEAADKGIKKQYKKTTRAFLHRDALIVLIFENFTTISSH